jgi:hypothetical protein
VGRRYGGVLGPGNQKLVSVEMLITIVLSQSTIAQINIAIEVARSNRKWCLDGKTQCMHIAYCIRVTEYVGRSSVCLLAREREELLAKDPGYAVRLG